jgi:YesN/AraC family two-component response regulator
MPALIKVIIADDHRIFVDGLSEIIARISGVAIVATASNGEEVLQKIEKTTCEK